MAQNNDDMKKEARYTVSPSPATSENYTVPPVMSAASTSADRSGGGRPERRTRNRVKLAEPLVGRVNSFGAVLIDVSESGARIEHYHRMQTGADVTLRFDWEGTSISTDCRVVACRVHRFTPGDDGITIYQSGLMFTQPEGPAASALKRLTSTFIARALAEQVANAKGVIPVFEEDEMPIFRSGVLASNEYANAEARKDKHLIPGKKLVRQRGYVRCTLEKGNWWKKKWTMDPAQPVEGFTVSVYEAIEQVDLLCETYRKADRQARVLIRRMAEMSLEKEEEE